jgi:hypothetical protein
MRGSGLRRAASVLVGQRGMTADALSCPNNIVSVRGCGRNWIDACALGWSGGWRSRPEVHPGNDACRSFCPSRTRWRAVMTAVRAPPASQYRRACPARAPAPSSICRCGQPVGDLRAERSCLSTFLEQPSSYGGRKRTAKWPPACQAVTIAAAAVRMRWLRKKRFSHQD